MGNKPDCAKGLCELRNELFNIANELERWYDIGRVSWYMVEVYSKGHSPESGYDDNIFDIFDDEIAYYDDDISIPSDAMRVVLKVQEQMKKIGDWFDNFGK